MARLYWPGPSVATVNEKSTNLRLEPQRAGIGGQMDGIYGTPFTSIVYNLKILSEHRGNLNI